MSWFAFDIEDYDADTMHLTAAEDGMYGRLLRFYYKTRMPLPDDDRALAAISRVAASEWEASKETVLSFFRRRRGKLHHKRCDKELDREDSLAKNRSERAKRAIAKRWANSKTSLLPVLRPNARSSDSVILGDTTRPDQTKEKKEQNARERASSDEGFESWYGRYPNKVSKGAARVAYGRAVKKATEADLVAGLDRYIAGKPSDVRWCNPATWLNGERWNDQPDLMTARPVNGTSTPPPTPGEPWEQRMRGWRDTGVWLASWGFKPGEPGCRVPPDLLGDARRV